MILDKLAIKPLLITIAVLGALLIASGWYNVHQFKVAAQVDTEHAAAMAAAVAAAKVEGMEAAMSQSDEIAAQAEEQRVLLVAEFEKIRQQEAQANADYARRLAAMQPLPSNCGPGAARIDAFNAGY